MRFASAATLLFASAFTSACSSSGTSIDADEAVIRMLDSGLHNPVVRDAAIVEVTEPSAAHDRAHTAIVDLRGVTFEIESSLDAGARRVRE
jgi:hypothetical protein